MTFIIYGVGAIGGTIAARLADSGQPVVGIARGTQLAALQAAGGLLLRTPTGDIQAKFRAVADPTELEFAPDDVIFLCMKGQDTAPALERLRAAGVRDQAIVCAQNGVANERMALRYFANVYAMMVALPGTFIRPGEVAAFGAPNSGLFDIGRYPLGTDSTVDSICATLNAAGFSAAPHPTAMQSKYAKLLLNLSNVLDAATGQSPRDTPVYAAARREAEAVLTAAGIAYEAAETTSNRRERLMKAAAIPGAERVGSSSAQSLARGAGSIETDYLNGEIVLLGRLHGIPVPANEALCRLGHLLVAEKRGPGTMSMDEVTALMR